MIMRAIGILSACLMLLPSEAEALALSQFVGLFHIVIGLLLVATLGVFGIGFGMYISRFNTWPSYRDNAIKILIWAVTMLFILILFIALVQFIQRHTALALSILAVIIILGVVILIAKMSGGGGGGEGAAKKPAGKAH